MFPQCFPVLPHGKHCFQRQFCFQEAKFTSVARQKHLVFPCGMEAWQNEETITETCFLVLPGLYHDHPCLKILFLFSTADDHILSFVQVHHKVEKSHSEPAIPPSDDQSRPPQKPQSGRVHSSTDARKLSAQSSSSTGGGSERKPRKTSRTRQGASLNEVRMCRDTEMGQDVYRKIPVLSPGLIQLRIKGATSRGMRRILV